MEKSDLGEGKRERERLMEVYNVVVKKSLTEMMTFEQKPKKVRRHANLMS